MLTFKRGQGWIEETYPTLEFPKFTAELRFPNVGERFTYVAANNVDPHGWIIFDNFNEQRVTEWLGSGYDLENHRVFNGDIYKSAPDLERQESYWKSEGLKVYFITLVPK